MTDLLKERAQQGLSHPVWSKVQSRKAMSERRPELTELATKADIFAGAIYALAGFADPASADKNEKPVPVTEVSNLLAEIVEVFEAMKLA